MDNPVMLVGKFVPKTNSMIIGLGISILISLVSKYAVKRTCQKIKNPKISAICNATNKQVVLWTIFMFILYSSIQPIIYNIQNMIINRQAYLTLEWFEKYIKIISKYNLSGINFNIHAKINE